MPRTRLIWQIFPPFFFIVLAAILGIALYTVHVLDSHHRAMLNVELETEGKLLREQIADVLPSGDRSRLDKLVQGAARTADIRVTVTDPKGQVLSDSLVNATDMDSHSDRPEIRAALDGQIGKSIRLSHTTRQRQIYVALPVEVEGRILGVVRTSVSADADARSLRPYHVKIGLGLAGVSLLALLATWAAWRRVANQLEAIRHGAKRFAGGELDSRVPVSDTTELAGIAEAMNRMGGQLQERMQTVLRQRNELQAVLASMEESVVAVDADERLINVNRAAAELFEVNAAGAQGRSVQEIIRNTELQRFIARTLASNEPVEGDITLYHDGGDRTLQAHGTALRDGRGHNIGGLLVLNDVTRLRRLENSRRDFVANVSHELRTPITSIKGYVETLIDGAAQEPESAQRFLRIILNQADRLNALIGDLLDLSRMEEQTEHDTLAVEPTRMLDVLENAVKACQSGADEKKVRLELECDPETKVTMNAAFVEQAVVNLLDNAIKYSNPDSRVSIAGAMKDGEFAIHVSDTGCGIDQEHLPRLFERFYRVDKARSRKMGGTGLGLAIVKHIVRLHGGRTHVESTPGKGSTFSIYLPMQ